MYFYFTFLCFIIYFTFLCFIMYFYFTCFIIYFNLLRTILSSTPLRIRLDCVSIGPDLTEIHTPRERMHIASVQRTWALLTETLRRMK